MRLGATAVALAATLLLAGCSPDEQPEPDHVAAEAAEVGWSPCDGVHAASVARYAGQEMTEQNGTADQPRCTFTPGTEGGPAFDVNFLWFAGSLDQAWESMGKVNGDVTRVHVPGAEAARLVVHARPPAVIVSGFVQTKGLVQSVNAVQLKPYDEQAVVGATKKLLAELVRKAPERAS